MRTLHIVDNDYHTYPAYLMLLFTRYKWFENEGYDSTGAKNDFDKAFAWFAGTDSGATVLNLVPGSAFPYLTVGRNLPDTGYGQ
jgi:hypothetical protein